MARELSVSDNGRMPIGYTLDGLLRPVDEGLNNLSSTLPLRRLRHRSTARLLSLLPCRQSIGDGPTIYQSEGTSVVEESSKNVPETAKDSAVSPPDGPPLRCFSTFHNTFFINKIRPMIASILSSTPRCGTRDVVDVSSLLGVLPQTDNSRSTILNRTRRGHLDTMARRFPRRAGP